MPLGMLCPPKKQSWDLVVLEFDSQLFTRYSNWIRIWCQTRSGREPEDGVVSELCQTVPGVEGMTYQIFFVVEGDVGIRMVDAIMKSECCRKAVSCDPCASIEEVSNQRKDGRREVELYQELPRETIIVPDHAKAH